MQILDSSALLAALDPSLVEYQRAQCLISRGQGLALTRQIIRETWATATRPLTANGLGLPCKMAWPAIESLVLACGQVLDEDARWQKFFSKLVRSVQPHGRVVFDMGQLGSVLAVGRHAKLVSDDQALIGRCGHLAPCCTVAQAVAGLPADE